MRLNYLTLERRLNLGLSIENTNVICPKYIEITQLIKFKRRRGKTVGRTACLLLLRIWSETLKATKSILHENINSKNNNQG